MKKRTTWDKNEIIDCGDYYEICLYNVKSQEIARTKIDKDDLEKIKNSKWCLMYGYAISNSNNKSIYLHTFILGKPTKGYEIDHINHDKLDNRKQNLRFVTHSQNGMNRKYKGYYWSKSDKRWHARIIINQKRINLGYFINEQDAINARKIAVEKYFGEYAYNFN